MSADAAALAYRRLLVPVDGSALSTRAIRESLSLARKLDALVIGFVVEGSAPLPAAGMHLSQYKRAVSAHEEGSDAHAQKLLSGFASAAAEHGVDFEGHFVVDDDVAAAIAHAAARYRVDLIVMVTHGRGVFGELFFGSHTKRVLSLTKTPLLVLH